jgi:hypothetical protein
MKKTLIIIILTLLLFSCGKKRFFKNPDDGPQTMEAYIFGDTDNDGDADADDYLLSVLAIGGCDSGCDYYNELADADHDGYVTRKDIEDLYPVVPVRIDIKPGCDPNTIDLSSAGVIPVAILSTKAFDAAKVNPKTVTLTGAAIKLAGKSDKNLAYKEDLNGDGLPDLICRINTDESILQTGDTVAILEGTTLDGAKIRGEDHVRIVPDI